MAIEAATTIPEGSIGTSKCARHMREIERGNRAGAWSDYHQEDVPSNGPFKSCAHRSRGRLTIWMAPEIASSLH
jgi:hypothetical protein